MVTYYAIKRLYTVDVLMSRGCCEVDVNYGPKMLKNTGNKTMFLHTSKTISIDVRNSAYTLRTHNYLPNRLQSTLTPLSAIRCRLELKVKENYFATVQFSSSAKSGDRRRAMFSVVKQKLHVNGQCCLFSVKSWIKKGGAEGRGILRLRRYINFQV